MWQWSRRARHITVQTHYGRDMRIAIALFDGVEELDFAGPWEVLAYWARELAADAEVFTVAASLGPVTAAKGLSAGGALMASVCTGALVYAAAGLLRGRPATTHWDNLDELAALDGTIAMRPDARYVDDGNVITAAGVSAGIDMALHLVVRLDSADAARRTRREIQYDPDPPV